LKGTNMNDYGNQARDNAVRAHNASMATAKRNSTDYLIRARSTQVNSTPGIPAPAEQVPVAIQSEQAGNWRPAGSRKSKR
jgi:hypothetical protein